MEAAADRGVFAEAVVFLSYFDDLPDPRQRGKVVYPLDEVLLLALLAVLAGAETFVDIARFGAKKLALLRRFRPFRDGTPSHDHLGDIFAAVDAAAFQRCFVAWVAALVGTAAEVIAIDGKTARRSGQKTSGKAPIPMVSAFAARQRLVLGQVKVAENSGFSPVAKGEIQVVTTTRRAFPCGAQGRTNPYERGRPVMRPEQRGWAKRLSSTSNWQQEETLAATKP